MSFEEWGKIIITERVRLFKLEKMSNSRISKPKLPNEP